MMAFYGVVARLGMARGEQTIANSQRPPFLDGSDFELAWQVIACVRTANQRNVVPVKLALHRRQVHNSRSTARADFGFRCTE